MRQLSGILLALGLAAGASACSDDSTSPVTDPRFSVTYEVTGTFDGCTVFFITRRDDVAPDQENEGGDSRSEDVTLPWTHSFDITVTARRPFNTQVNAVCSAAGAREVTATVSIDGDERDSDTQSGQNVNASAGVQLTASG